MAIFRVQFKYLHHLLLPKWKCIAENFVFNWQLTCFHTPICCMACVSVENPLTILRDNPQRDIYTILWDFINNNKSLPVWSHPLLVVIVQVHNPRWFFFYDTSCCDIIMLWKDIIKADDIGVCFYMRWQEKEWILAVTAVGRVSLLKECRMNYLTIVCHHLDTSSWALIVNGLKIKLCWLGGGNLIVGILELSSLLRLKSNLRS